ncbi:phospholipase-like protein [Tanacetum coccineum]|uniref:Phospholipase-like protein n=1 Tax=Tanacetum coccineum TaxID=301880 RepID=A0ABQ4X7T8_9ASTR
MVVSREVHVRTEVRRDVQVRTDVYHYVDEGLSVQDLVKKIGDMQREFQSRITAVEQYVNQHKSFSRFIENPDDRAALINKITDMRTSVESDVDNQNVDFDYDPKPSCESDNHVKTLIESNVDNQNVDNHSMDFHHDPKHSCGSDNHVKTSVDNHSMDNQKVENHSMDFDHDPKALEEPKCDQQFARRIDAHKKKELFAVETLYSMIDFDIPKEVDVNPTIAVNSLRVPLERDHKVSRYLQDPYMIQPDSTEPNHKVRARHKKNKKRCMPLTTPDGKLILAWTELLIFVGFRPSNAPKTRVNVPKEIINFLRETEEQHFYFPWSMDGTFVYNNFWQGLLGIGKESRGWLSNMHLDLWVLYLWHFRPADADWAIAGPFFNTFMLGYELPCCYADDVTYGVPWFAQSVEKTKVLDKKNIDAANYSITYRYAVNVPRQGDAYGDCGIWVMRNLYRLVNNLSLDVSNLTQLGLAYREWLTDFFWKYKIPVKK